MPSDRSHLCEAWPSILDAAMRIIEPAARHHVTVCEPSGYDPPIISRRNGIHLGGNTAEGLPRRPLLLLPAPYRHPNPGSAAVSAASGSADTSRLPDDAVVTAILPRCDQLLGDGFSVRSRRQLDSQWLHGAADGVPDARQPLALLFSPYRRHRR